ncbi:MAG TPA: hypothetical protein VGE88_00285 [Lysobacter sp.]
MKWLELTLAFTGAISLIAGYRTNNRNLLVAGAVVLALATARPDCISGFIACL